MDAEKAELLLKTLGCDKIKYGSRWINAACPFASWRHSKGADKHPSFGLLVSSGRSFYRCHSCGVSGDMHALVWRLAKLRGEGKWYERACLLVSRDSASLQELEEMSELSKAPVEAQERLERSTYWGSTPVEQPPPRALSLDALEYAVLAEQDLRAFRELPPVASNYLLGPKRRLQAHTLELWELGWQPYARRIVIPVRDWEGRLVGLTGRPVEDDIEPKYLHSTGFKRDYFLFGEHLAERGEIGYLVEGHFDAIYLRQMGYANAVAVMGSHLSRVQVEKLVKLFSSVVIVPDGDDAGGNAAVKWEYALKGRVPVRIVSVMEDRDPDEYSQEELDSMLAIDDAD